MIATAAVLIPFLIADVINPVLFAFLVFAAGSDRPVINSSAVLVGHTLAYLVVGILAALGLEKITALLANPGTIDYLVGLAVGILLLWMAFPGAPKGRQKDPEQGGTALTPLSALGLGALINFIGAPFALPYFAAIDQVLKADLGTLEVLGMLLGYNLLYALPFSLVPVAVAVFGDRSRPLLERINQLLERTSAFLMPLVLGLAGLALIADAALYFTTGSGLF